MKGTLIQLTTLQSVIVTRFLINYRRGTGARYLIGDILSKCSVAGDLSVTNRVFASFFHFPVAFRLLFCRTAERSQSAEILLVGVLLLRRQLATFLIKLNRAIRESETAAESIG